MQGDGTPFDNRGIRMQRSRVDNMSMVPGARRHLTNLDGGGMGHRGSLSPGNLTGANKNLYKSNLDDRRNLKTGAPVDFEMLPEDNDGSPRNDE